MVCFARQHLVKCGRWHGFSDEVMGVHNDVVSVEFGRSMILRNEGEFIPFSANASTVVPETNVGPPPKSAGRKPQKSMREIEAALLEVEQAEIETANAKDSALYEVVSMFDSLPSEPERCFT